MMSPGFRHLLIPYPRQMFLLYTLILQLCSSKNIRYNVGIQMIKLFLVVRNMLPHYQEVISNYNRNRKFLYESHISFVSSSPIFIMRAISSVNNDDGAHVYSKLPFRFWEDLFIDAVSILIRWWCVNKEFIKIQIIFNKNLQA